MTIKLFVAGTDTDIGKTYISAGILNTFKKNRYSTLGLKPVASGCHRKNNQLQNGDALTLQQASSIQLHYHQINPFAFELSIAPHIAAKYENREISVHDIKQKIQYAIQYPADICLVEGVGGWRVPINEHETMADFVKSAELKVLLVVGLRLGCINHALLTSQAILQDNINLVGWIGNCIDPMMLNRDENVDTLKKWIKAPFLGLVEYEGKIEDSIDIHQFLAL